MNLRGPVNARRAGSLALTVLIITLAGYLLAELYVLGTMVSNGQVTASQDYQLYMDRARSWLAGDGFYLSRQLTGRPYVVAFGDATYPPPVLLLLVPFTVLPAVLWWVVPLSIVGVSLVRLRPPRWTWPLLMAALSHPLQLQLIAAGNPGMWAQAALTAGLARGWPAPLAAMKLTIAPFALAAFRRPGYRRGVVLALAASLLFLPMWPDFFTAILNARNGGRLDYLVGEWPTAAVLVVVGFASLRAGRENAELNDYGSE